MKKFMALFATSVLFASMTVSAAGSPSAAVVASTAVKDLRMRELHRQRRREA